MCSTEHVADGTRFRSDSDLARQLQEEWNAQEEGKSESEEIPLPMKKVTRHRTDRYAPTSKLFNNADI